MLAQEGRHSAICKALSQKGCDWHKSILREVNLAYEKQQITNLKISVTLVKEIMLVHTAICKHN